MKKIVIGNRIPNQFFITKGSGESDIAIHSGSYHLALKQAGIENANIITYSSILPPSAKETEFRKQNNGAVLECIMSVGHTTTGCAVCAGIGYSWLYNPTTKEKEIGIVVEHAGNFSLSSLKERINESLNELYQNGFQHLIRGGNNYVIEYMTPKKKYGTALVAICFQNYIIPKIK